MNTCIHKVEAQQIIVSWIKGRILSAFPCSKQSLGSNRYISKSKAAARNSSLQHFVSTLAPLKSITSYGQLQRWKASLPELNLNPQEPKWSKKRVGGGIGHTPLKSVHGIIARFEFSSLYFLCVLRINLLFHKWKSLLVKREI